MANEASDRDGLGAVHPIAERWFRSTLGSPTRAQRLAWPVIARGQSTLLLAPTGSGKTLAAFFVALSRLLTAPPGTRGTRVLYLSPLKALGADVERNLRSPLQGIAREAEQQGVAIGLPSIGVRSGDTPAAQRLALTRNPADILITTPESLYLMLTSRARETLRAVEVVIVDEIHALCSNKRGAHLMLSLERLEALRPSSAAPLQRIGLSATQRPLSAVATFLAGTTLQGDEWVQRPLTIVDAGQTKKLELRVEMPLPSPRTAHDTETQPENSVWPPLHARLLELIEQHRSTLVFVNSRRLAERLAAAVNELANREVVLVHHGSVAKETRREIEERLKAGDLPALVATSSLELGIDMGAVDLVVQVEAPPSVAAALQRVGRAGHRVGETSRGVFFAKFRADLLACAAVCEHAQQGLVEETRCPKNPLDVLAQHIVSMLVVQPLHVDEVYELVRRASPFAALSRKSFDSVISMLSGERQNGERLPAEARVGSIALSQLAPRINHDLATGQLTARRGARLIALANAGAIVDRGAYAVFLTGSAPPVRVGELDEEMVFESRQGDVFLLGASSWRVDEITFDRVWVSPAPGQPARMPFWRGARPSRPVEFGRAMGELCRSLQSLELDAATSRLVHSHGLTDSAAEQLFEYLAEQSKQAQLPSDRKVVLEWFPDEVGDLRVVLLSFFGGRVHAPWSAVVREHLRQTLRTEVDSVWSDDGLVFRLPGLDTAPDPDWFLPTSERARVQLMDALPTTPLFATVFRECAARAGLLPRRRPGQRVPLWAHRRRAADLLSLVSELPDFPIVIEAYRECLQDVFDIAAWCRILDDLHAGQIELSVCPRQRPSPFAAALLFAYSGNFIYSQDAPLAERRAQSLNIDPEELQSLLGEPVLRKLLEPEAITAVEEQLQLLRRAWPSRDADDVFDLLRKLGDLSFAELEERVADTRLQAWLSQLQTQARAIPLQLGGQQRWILSGDLELYRSALGAEVPAQRTVSNSGEAALHAETVVDSQAALDYLLERYAATHGPFEVQQPERRWGLSPGALQDTCTRLHQTGKLRRGAFLPHGKTPEYCHPEVLRRIKRASLERLRREIEPVPPWVYASFLREFQHLASPLAGRAGLLTVLEQLQGISLPYSTWVQEVLPRRVNGFSPYALDEVCAAGLVWWRASGQGGADARVAFYLVDDYELLAPGPEPVAGELAERVRHFLKQRGAVFFSELSRSLAGYPAAVFETLWQMVAAGEVSNDTLAPLRARLEQRSGRAEGARADRRARIARSARRRLGRLPAPSASAWTAHAQNGATATERPSADRWSAEPGTEGRWWLLPEQSDATPTERLTAAAEQLLCCHGVVARETALHAAVPGGFAALLPVVQAQEEAGRLRRGYFLEGLGANQFAAGGAETTLRQLRTRDTGLWLLSALDPANPYGAVFTWPAHPSARPARSAGHLVVLSRGRLRAFITRDWGQLWLYAPEASEGSEGSDAQREASALAELLVQDFDSSADRARLITEIDGQPAASLRTASPSPVVPLAAEAVTEDAQRRALQFAALVRQALCNVGFRPSHEGLHKRREVGG